MNGEMINGTGLLQPLYEDPRDIPLGAFEEPVAAGNLPQSYYADMNGLGVNHQGRTGSCVGQAVSKMKEYQEHIEDGIPYRLSPRYVYANCKKIDGYDGWGTFIQTGLKVSDELGVCRTNEFFPEATHLPDKEFRDWNVITDEAYEEGKNFRTRGRAMIRKNDLLGIKSALVKHGVLIGGVTLSSEGFRITAEHPEVRAPLDTEVKYGHCMAFTAYQTQPDGKTQLWFLNSWGVDWGNQGRGYLVYEDYKDIFNFWVSTDMPSELITKAKTMIPLIQGDERPEVYAHNVKKNYKSWVNQTMLMNWMGQLWGEEGWDLAQLMSEYVRVIPQAEVDALRELDTLVGKVQA